MLMTITTKSHMTVFSPSKYNTFVSLLLLPSLSSPYPSFALHKAYKGVVDFGEEPGTSPKAGWWDGGGGSSDPDTTPMTSHKSWMPEYGE